MKCPRCGADASGKFCSTCGSQISGTSCGSCGAALNPGARFCHACGASSAGDSRAPAGSHTGSMPWIIAGGAVVALLIVLAFTQLNPGAGTPPAAGPGTGAASGAPDISQMTPREQADALFNRVMTAAENGDQQTVTGFSPMALEAYRVLGELDTDARYHVGLINLVTGSYDVTLAQADSIAQTAPTHLYAIILRAEVAKEQDDGSALRAAQQAFLDAYEAERATNRPEYDEHPRMLERFRDEVLQALGRTAEN